jgi:predicted phosphoadenosine phosphosulfate sulfurtransferase
MARVRRYLEISVLEAAYQRVEHIEETFDNLVYMFSGGKDSQAMLHLAKAVHEDHNLGPVRAIFRDEEFIPQSAIDNVLWYHKQPWLDLRWVCFRQRKDVGIFHDNRTVFAWDTEREWFRQPPSFAEMPGELFDSWLESDRWLVKGLKGKIGFVMGVRAEESLARYRSVVNKLNENYINATAHKDIKLVKPLYDWTENDVLKYLSECGVQPARWYNSALIAGAALRLAVPFSPHAAAQIARLDQMDPELYAKGLGLVPEIAVVARYDGEYDRYKRLKAYEAEGWDGCRRYAREHFDGVTLAKCLQFILDNEVLARRSPQSYTVKETLRKVYNGVSHMTSPLPARKKGRKHGSNRQR